VIEGIDEAFAFETIDWHLTGKCSVRRAGTERLASGFPRAVVRAFEIGDENVIGSGEGSGGDGRDANKQRRFHVCSAVE